MIEYFSQYFQRNFGIFIFILGFLSFLLNSNNLLDISLCNILWKGRIGVEIVERNMWRGIEQGRRVAERAVAVQEPE